ncbi:hypothetical protein ACHAXR_005915, partial [Thalassiosira sp. AJA248-18]
MLKLLKQRQWLPQWSTTSRRYHLTLSSTNFHAAVATTTHNSCYHELSHHRAPPASLQICSSNRPSLLSFTTNNYSSTSLSLAREKQERGGGGGRHLPRAYRNNNNNKNHQLFGHDYKQVGNEGEGPIDPITCPLTEQEIHNLIRQRVKFRRAQHFARADNILKELNKYGVQMDDKSKEWWASTNHGSARGGGGGSQREEGVVVNQYNKFGHEYEQIGGTFDPSMCTLTEDEIHNLIRKRMQNRKARDFDMADTIRLELSEKGIHMDDTLKQWWVAGTRAIVNEFGHYYEQVGGPIDSSMAESEIHDLIRERMHRRRNQNYGQADNILKELGECGVYIDDKAKEWRADGKSFTQNNSSEEDDGDGTTTPTRTQSPRMKDCQTLEEAIEVTYGHLGKLTTRDISAFWAVVPQFLEQRNAHKNPDHNAAAAAQLGSILAHTLEQIKSFDYRDLSTTTLGLAKIMKHVGSSSEKDGHPPPKGSLHRILHDILIGNSNSNSKNKQTIFRHLARSSISALHEFDARCLANLCYAYAIADYTPKFKDGSTLLDHLAEKSIPMLGEFTPQGLSKMLWAYSTLGISNSALFEEAGDVILGLHFSSSFKPHDLSNIVWAYATLDESHPILFIEIANHLVTPLDNNVGLLNAQDCADTVWAYATAGVSHPELFKEISERVVEIGSTRPL